MAHGIARLSPKYCRDHMRWASLGHTESEWWQSHLLVTRCPMAGGFLCDMCLSLGGEAVAICLFQDWWDEDGPVNEFLQATGFPAAGLSMARNPGFHDPFPVNQETLRSHKGLFTGKLDWMLLRGFTAEHMESGNKDYLASDHRLLTARCTPTPDATTVRPPPLPAKRSMKSVLAVLVLLSAYAAWRTWWAPWPFYG